MPDLVRAAQPLRQAGRILPVGVGNNCNTHVRQPEHIACRCHPAFVATFDRPRRTDDFRAVSLRALIIDYNGFFASCEQQERPELRGRPVAVVPVMTESTCVIASSYDARARGIKVGTPVSEARQLCPGIVIIESRPEVYIRYHQKLITAVETCLPITEVWSIDEVWCTLPPDWQNRTDALATSRKIKTAIRLIAGECLTCSIGVAPNAWLAKIASDLEKPDGLVVIESEELPQRLFPLKLRDLPGIGGNMETRLRTAGLDTVEKLYAASVEKLRHIWGGIEGERMWERLRGTEVPLPPKRTSSLGHSHVLPPHLRNLAGAEATLHRLLQKASMRLRASGFYAGGMHLALRLSGHKQWSTAATFTETQDTLELTRIFNLLWVRRPSGTTAIHGVGVTLFDLGTTAGHTAMLPGIVDNGDKRAGLNAALDHINKKLGKNTVVFGGALGALDYAPVRIAFNRIPDLQIEEGDASGDLRPNDDELARFRLAPRVSALSVSAS
ncbi:DNA polymerase [Rariglobus hedericola]|uniref:DNA polymerase n=1 Tax=Rariglobus hedericola TaxID=2597822 RepID=A0A556QJD9_9BACT|nr:DNA polymerase [Rariglobus hedericola]